ncbi:GGDEF domain-containing protein [Methylicorpusculum oleiharenae]|nr:GGDEF domain-containing protein [Methylicorpusculum oleiharenae]
MADVDDQHHKLVDMMNEFGELLTENELKLADIEDLLSRLADYAQYHFQDEEKLMLESGIDDRHLQFQKNEHNSFMQQVFAMKAELCPTSGAGSEQLLGFLINWLAYHILGVDQDMARQLAAIKAGKSAQDAYLADEKNRSQTTEPLLAALTGLFHQLSARNLVLQEMNKTLESKVQERTQALSDANVQLEKIAMTDVLTELPNRRYAMNVLRQLWSATDAKASLLACMMIDADGFKQINDNYGHDSGDALLQVLARELKYSVRTDEIVCRLGGDEFLIICRDTPLEGAINLAELIRKNIANLQVTVGEGIWLGSISVGVAVRKDVMETPDALLKAADEGVYLAKRDGKNCVRSSQVTSKK